MTRSRRTRTAVACALTVAAAATWVAAGGHVVYEFPTRTFAVGDAGDVDEDGVTDLFVQAPDLTVQAGGAVLIVSGKDFTKTLRTFASPHAGIGLGGGVAQLGDVNGDSVSDVLVVEPGRAGGSALEAFAHVVSGADGAFLLEIGPVAPNQRWGGDVAAMGDLNGDGTPDFAISAGGVFNASGGRVEFHSAKEVEFGTLIGQVYGEGLENLGTAIARLDDVTGDGVADLVIGCPRWDEYDGFGRVLRRDVGRVLLVSGATREIVKIWVGPRADAYFGSSLAALARSGPGATRFVVGSPGYTVSSEVAVYDAKTFKRLLRISAPPKREFGTAVAGLGDVDGDGQADFAASSTTTDHGGAVVVFSTATRRPLFTYAGAPGENVQSYVRAIGDLDDVPGEEFCVLTGGYLGVGRILHAEKTADMRVRVALQRNPLAPDLDALGTIEARVRSELQSFRISVRRLAEGAGGTFGIFLEDGPAAGTFRQIGTLEVVGAPQGTWLFDIQANGAIPQELEGTRLSSLAGRIVEIRDVGGAAVLRAVVPAVGDVAVFRRTAALAPAVGSPNPTAVGAVRLTYNGAVGTSQLVVTTTRLAVGPTYTTWVEDAVGVGNFISAGDLVRGRLSIDTRTGAPLPAGISDVRALVGRRVQIRAGDVVQLEGVVQ